MQDIVLEYDDNEIIKLVSSDQVEVETTVGVVKHSDTIKNLIFDCDIENPIPLPNVTSQVLTEVLKYMEHLQDNPLPHTEEDTAKRELTEWEQKFCSALDQATLFELILAANYLDSPKLLDVSCKAAAGMIRGKTTEEIRETFHIVNDFTPEEEEQIRKENEWCEDRV